MSAAGAATVESEVAASHTRHAARLRLPAGLAPRGAVAAAARQCNMYCVNNILYKPNK